MTGTGATLGNMICINNIISAKVWGQGWRTHAPQPNSQAVMNLNHISEGVFIFKTAPVALVMAVISTVVGFLFTFLF